MKKIKINYFKRANWKKWILPFTGLIAFVWFLVRVIPKPSRANYPCQRAAFPMATSFIIWLTGAITSLVSLKFLKQRFNKFSKFVTVCVVCIFAGSIYFTMQFFPSSLRAETIKLKEKSKVSIVQSTQSNASSIQFDEIKKMVKDACDMSGGLSSVIKDGDVVVLKPNLVSANGMKPEVNGTNTDWRITKATAQLIRDINPSGKIYILEGSSANTQTAYNTLSYTKANFPEVDLIATLESDSGKWNDKSSSGIVKMTLPDGLLHTEYYLNKKIKEADCLISLSCLKTHWSAGITGSCKNIGIGATPPNIYGVADGNPFRNNMVTHDNVAGDLHKWIRDYYKLRPADFTIIDGLQGLQNGPISTSSSDKMNMRLILAGKDAVAVDTICGLTMNWDPESISYLKYLNADSIGNLDVSCIDVVGKKVDEVRKDFAGKIPMAGGAKVTDKTAPTLTLNSTTVQNGLLNLNSTVGSDAVKSEVYIDGVLKTSVSSNLGSIALNINDLTLGTHTASIATYDRFLNRTEKTFTFTSSGSVISTNNPTTTSTNSLKIGDYNCLKATQLPTIDGNANDNCWSQASWGTISFPYVGSMPSTSDFSGRYKMVWGTDRLYYLVEITDDVFSAPYTDPLVNYYNNDCVELFIDEDKSGGEHTNNYNAFAYHIQKNGNVTDNALSGKQKTYNDHVEVKVTQSGNVYTWEIALKVFADTYDENSTTNPVVKLSNGKIMGFGVSYNDNDGGKERENMMGSMEITGSDKNIGYKNASVFGTLYLSDNIIPSNTITTTPKPSSSNNINQLGDINNDGKITSTDEALVQRYILGIVELTSSQKILADVNKDGKINTTDDSLITRVILGVLDSFV